MHRNSKNGQFLVEETKSSSLLQMEGRFVLTSYLTLKYKIVIFEIYHIYRSLLQLSFPKYQFEKRIGLLKYLKLSENVELRDLGGVRKSVFSENPGLKVVNKFKKLSGLGFCMECFTKTSKFDYRVAG